MRKRTIGEIVNQPTLVLSKAWSESARIAAAEARKASKGDGHKQVKENEGDHSKSQGDAGPTSKNTGSVVRTDSRPAHQKGYKPWAEQAEKTNARIEAKEMPKLESAGVSISKIDTQQRSTEVHGTYPALGGLKGRDGTDQVQIAYMHGSKQIYAKWSAPGANLIRGDSKKGDINEALANLKVEIAAYAERRKSQGLGL